MLWVDEYFLIAVGATKFDFKYELYVWAASIKNKFDN